MKKTEMSSNQIKFLLKLGTLNKLLAGNSQASYDPGKLQRRFMGQYEDSADKKRL